MTLTEKITELLNAENDNSLTPPQRLEWMMREVAKFTYETVKPKIARDGETIHHLHGQMEANAREAGILE